MKTVEPGCRTKGLLMRGTENSAFCGAVLTLYRFIEIEGY